MKSFPIKILIFVLPLYLIFSIATIFIQPSGDDWAILTKPNWNLGIGPIYRPFEVLFSIVALKYPSTFPYLNHLVILLCHLLNTYLLYHLIRKFNVDEKTALISSMFFLFAPSVMGAVTSVDGTNQTISTFFSLLGFFGYYKHKGLLKYLGWLAFTMMAAMHKEIGITWFIGTPLLAYIIDYPNRKVFFTSSSFKSLLFNATIGLIFVGIYFVIRINTSISGMISTNDVYPKYTIGLGKNLFVNLGLLLSSCATAIDTVAYFGYPKRYYLTILTVILSIPFAVLTAIRVYDKTIKEKQWNQIVLFIVFSIIVISPHLVMGRCGELHAYSLALPYSVLLAVIFNNKKSTKITTVILIIFGISIIIVDSHKWYGTYKNGYYGLKIANEIKEQTRGIPKRVKVITIIYRDSHIPYSSFYHDEKWAYNPYLMRLHYSQYFEKLDHLPLNAHTLHLKDKIDSVISDAAEKKYEFVWIIDKSNAKVIKL